MPHRALTSRRGAWVMLREHGSLHCCPRARCADMRPARAGIAHLMGSLKAEAAQAGAPVGVHTLSPGMVLTDLLLEGASDANKQARAWPPLALASRAPDGARDSRHPATPCARGRAGRLRCWRCPRVHAWPARELAQGGWEPYPNPPWSVARRSSISCASSRRRWLRSWCHACARWPRGARPAATSATSPPGARWSAS